MPADLLINDNLFIILYGEYINYLLQNNTVSIDNINESLIRLGQDIGDRIMHNYKNSKSLKLLSFQKIVPKLLDILFNNYFNIKFIINNDLTITDLIVIDIDNSLEKYLIIPEEYDKINIYNIIVGVLSNILKSYNYKTDIEILKKVKNQYYYQINIKYIETIKRKLIDYDDD